MTKDQSNAEDHAYLERAVEISRDRMRAGKGGPFGAVIVKDSRILAEGWNEVTSANDPTAHAEVVVIRRACQEIGAFSLKGAKIYSSCEPCPMCLASIYWARLDGLVFANSRHQAAAIGFDDELLYREIGVPLGDRAIATLHMPMESAEDVFREWDAMENKIRY